VFATHPDLPDLLDDDAVLWRYVDLARYLDLIRTAELHLARADSMLDTWEGSFGHKNVELRPSIYGENYPMMAAAIPQMYEFARTHVFLSCWYAAPVESAAMWTIYDREQRGVALRTTHGRMREALRGTREVYGSTVEYADYSSTFIPEHNLFSPYRYKRASFEHEHEFRLIAPWFVKTEPKAPDSNEEIPVEPDAPPLVLREPVALEKLVESVRVSPTAPDWALEAIDDVTAKYGYKWPVGKSDLASGPIF
jgi:hypothetical protein